MTRLGFHTWSAILAVAWLILLGPGHLEGKIAPVVVDVELEAVQDPWREDWVLVSGAFTKIRNNCSPEFIRWRKGDRAGNDTPVEYIWGRPKVRKSGRHEFNDWQVRDAPPDVLIKDTFANVFHQCWIKIGPHKINLPWLTVTRFWN